MKIRSIYIKKFASITEKKFIFNDGINVIFGKNETGKTTLIQAIIANLYGFIKTTKMRTFTPEKDIYVDTHDFTILELENNGEIYIIERSVSDNLCNVIKDGKNINKEIKSVKDILIPGYSILGMDLIEFKNYLLFCEEDNEKYFELKNTASSDMIYKAYNKLLDENKNIGTYKSPTKQLSLMSKKVETNRKEMLNLQEEINKNKKDESDYKNKKEELKNLLEGKANIDKEIRITNEKILNSTFIEENQINDKKINKITIIKSIILVLLMILSFTTILDYLEIYSLISLPIYLNCAIILLLLILLLFLLRKKRKSIEIFDEEQKILEYRKKLDNEYKKVNDQILENYRSISYLEGKLSKNKEFLDNYYKLGIEQKIYEDKLDEIIKEKQIVENSILVLEKLFERKTEMYTEKIISEIRSLYQKITDKNDLQIAKDFTKVIIRDKILNNQQFSKGTSEVISFCEKLTFYKSKEDNRFLVLDDPFIYMDDERIENILKILNDMQNHQIIIATSSKRICEMLKEINDNAHIINMNFY